MPLDPARYIYELCVVLENGDTVPLGAATEALTWEENENEISVRLKAKLRNLHSGAQMVHELVALNSKVGLFVDWGEGSQEVFRGTVMDWKYVDDGTTSVEITAYDDLIHLQKSKDVYLIHNFWTAKQHIITLLSRWQMADNLDHIYGPMAQIPSPKAFRDQTVSDIITTILRLAFIHGQGKSFTNLGQELSTAVKEDAFLMRLRIINNKPVVEVVNEGGNQPIYWLREDTGIISVADERSIMDLVTVIKVSSQTTDLVDAPALRPPGPPKLTYVPLAGHLTAGTYAYRVTAWQADPNAITGATHQPETIASPESTVEVSDNGAVTLSWSAVPNATGYKVYGRRPGDNASGNQKKGFLAGYNFESTPGQWTWSVITPPNVDASPVTGDSAPTTWTDDGTAQVGTASPPTDSSQFPDYNPHSPEWNQDPYASTYTKDGKQDMLNKYGKFQEVWEVQSGEPNTRLYEQAQDYLRTHGVPNIVRTIVAPDLPFLRRGEYVAVSAGTIGTAEFDTPSTDPISKLVAEARVKAEQNSSWTTPAVLYVVTGIQHDASTHQMTVSIDSYGLLGKKWSRLSLEDFLPDPQAVTVDRAAESQATAAQASNQTPTPPPQIADQAERIQAAVDRRTPAFQFTADTNITGNFVAGLRTRVLVSRDEPLTANLVVNHTGRAGTFRVLLEWHSTGFDASLLKQDFVELNVNNDLAWASYNVALTSLPPTGFYWLASYSPVYDVVARVVDPQPVGQIDVRYDLGRIGVQ